MSPRASLLFATLLGSTVFLSGCEGIELAYGDVNSIIVGAEPGFWAEVEDSVTRTLQPTITTTVQREEVFQVTHHDPADSAWFNLRKFKQMLLIGTPDQPWVAEALAEAGLENPTAPSTFQVNDIWARNQLATVVVLPESGRAEALYELLPGLAEQYLRQYRAWAVRRMFVSGRDSALADTLRAEAGFSLVLPEVYERRREAGTHIFRNDNPDPSELIRQIAVTWRRPDAASDSLARDELLAWRDEVNEAHYDPVQQVSLELVRAGPMGFRGHDAYQVQATWRNPPEADWPAAGPFILRAIECEDQDRLYLLDAWLYAPGKDKFEYMVQLETILDSFRCG